MGIGALWLFHDIAGQVQPATTAETVVAVVAFLFIVGVIVAAGAINDVARKGVAQR